MNEVVPLVLHLASHDINVGTSGIPWLKSHDSPHFDKCDLMNAMVSMTTLLALQRYVFNKIKY